MKMSRTCALLVAAFALPLAAQQTYTDHDYAQAERWMSYNMTSLTQHNVSSVQYLPDGRIFYADPGASGTLYYIADPAKGSKDLAFENPKLAIAVTAAIASMGGKTKITPEHVSVSGYKAEDGGFAIDLRGQTFHCDTAVTKCHPEPSAHEPVEKATAAAPVTATEGKAKPVAVKPPLAARAATGRRGRVPINLSPDKKLGVFIREGNLWMRVISTGEESQLTFDAVPDFGYATDNAGWQHSDSTIATWSRDSKMIATFQMDERKTGMMYLVSTTNRHPELSAWHYPLVGDKDVSMIEPVLIDVDTAKVTRLKTEPLQHRSMECDDISCDGDGKWSDVEFSPDGTRLAFVSTSRDHKDEWVKVADTTTGEVREVHHEHVDTYYGWQAKTDWKLLWTTNEFLWVSESSGYAQVYLYDLMTGKLKNQITRGDGPVWDLLHVDEKARTMIFSATGKEPGLDPYWRFAYSVGLDGKNQKLLTPEKMNHEIDMSPSGETFVDTYSNLDTPKTVVVRDSSGKVLQQLAKQDISALLNSGWKPPMSITVKARDGKTDLWGILWRPTTFDATKKYPLVDYVYPGPQDGGCSGVHSFNTSRGDNQALAELGFVVVCIDGMGNPHRSKAFHDAHASKPEDMGDDTIPDQESGIKDLAVKYPWVDATRVGIWGHSGGGNATVSAMFHAPDFFKVGWAESGNHDNRDYEDDWDERWAGLEVIGKDGKSNYDESANQNFAKNLKGKLMLVHGTMDDNVPPSNTLLVVDALMKANKDFDMLMVPNAHHGYGEMSQYIMRRRWDYFVKNLAGGTPPKEYKVKTYAEIIRALYGE